MSFSLRSTVIGTFCLMLLAFSFLGTLSIGLAVQSERHLTSLEKQRVIPAVALGILSQSLDQERSLLASRIGNMKPEQQRAVRDELDGLDIGVSADARRVLSTPSMISWRSSWREYTAARARYLLAVYRGHAREERVAGNQVADRLNAVLDVVQSETGANLNNSEKLYSRAIAADWMAVRMAIVAFLISLVMGTLLAVYIVQRMTRGLTNLTSTADHITRGNLDVRAHEGEKDEIGVVASAFNHMLDALLSAERQAKTDGLTGMMNHRAFHEFLTEQLEHAREGAVPLGLLMIDINDFKLFNDTYGHAVGDIVLQSVAQLVRAECRATDVVARYGGDEFVVLGRDTDLGQARAVAERIARATEKSSIRVGTGGERLPVTLSIGFASGPDTDQTSTELLELADRRMYEVKRSDGGVWAETGGTWTPRLSAHTPFGVLDGLVTAIDNKDRYTREHSEWVARFADMLAEALDFTPETRQQLTTAALIHDIGKIGIPDSILKKPYKLTDDEYKTMKTHVTLSELLVSQITPSSNVLDAVRYHHERWDGRGYPRGAAASDIPLVGRIMILADAASAMYLDRPYRKGLMPEELMAEVRMQRGTQFDPELADLFIRQMLAVPEGLRLEKSQGWNAVAS